MAEFDGLAGLRLVAFAATAMSLIAIFRTRQAGALQTAGALQISAMMLASLHGAVGDGLGAIAPIVYLGGVASCGWFWLFSRVLFRHGEQITLWMLGVVALITAPFIIEEIVTAVPFQANLEMAQQATRMGFNIERLVSSTVLCLGVLEALRQYGAQSKPEQRFRQGFIAIFGGLIALSMIWLRGSPETSFAGQAGDAFRTTFMIIAAFAIVYAVPHRTRTPLARQDTDVTNRRRIIPAAASPEDVALAARISDLVAREDVFTDAEIKVANVAAKLGEPDYKVTQAISRATAFPNFNRMINHHRIDAAKKMLRDPQLADRPILTIALESGFGSIGPFNRAFKESVGETPRAYRTRQLTDNSSSTQAGTTSPALP